MLVNNEGRFEPIGVWATTAFSVIKTGSKAMVVKTVSPAVPKLRKGRMAEIITELKISPRLNLWYGAFLYSSRKAAAKIVRYTFSSRIYIRNAFIFLPPFEFQ